MRRRRHGFTLIELLVVIAIIAILAAILFPVFARMREAARATHCRSNLKQIAAALTLYRDDYDGVNSPHRSCPDLPEDPHCFGQVDQSRIAGPNDVWWAPLDRQGKGPGDRIDFQAPVRNPPTAGLISPYIRNTDVFRCPSFNGQVGYAMSFIHRSPMGRPDAEVAQAFPDLSRAMLVWDHGNGPSCGGSGVPGYPADQRPPHTPLVGPQGVTHYPPRHLEGLNVLYYDGHAVWRKPESFRDGDFRPPGTKPPADPPLAP